MAAEMADAIDMIVRCCIHQRCGNEVDQAEFAAFLARVAGRAPHELSFQGLTAVERAAGMTAWCRVCGERFRDFEDAEGPCRPRRER
jgi:hypothetical protein